MNTGYAATTGLVMLAALTIAAGRAAAADVVEITDDALRGATGVIGLNMTAGEGNTQANLRAIAVGEDGLTYPAVSSDQRTGATCPGCAGATSVGRLGGAAFSDATGIISVNQSAGSAIAQSNLLAISIESCSDLLAAPIRNAADQELTLAAAGGTGSTPGAGPGYSADVVDGSAFTGATGLMQINQSAGYLNRVVNSVAVNFKAVDVK